MPINEPANLIPLVASMVTQGILTQNRVCQSESP